MYMTVTVIVYLLCVCMCDVCVHVSVCAWLLLLGYTSCILALDNKWLAGLVNVGLKFHTKGIYFAPISIWYPTLVQIIIKSVYSLYSFTLRACICTSVRTYCCYYFYVSFRTFHTSILVILCMFRRECFFTVESISFKSKFMTKLNNSFGSGGMTLALNEAQFSQFFQFLKHNISCLPKVKAVSHVGEQKDGVWVLNKSTQMNEAGEVIPEASQQYVWLEEAFTEKNASISLSQLISEAKIPTPDSSILYQ